MASSPPFGEALGEGAKLDADKPSRPTPKGEGKRVRSLARKRDGGQDVRAPFR